MGAEQPVLLYESAAKIYPRMVWGRYQNLRLVAMLALLGFYYAAPWILVGDTPLVWFDLPHRRFHVFGATLVPQDLIYLTGLLLIAALTLFFFTTLAGRLWCGYACPQTVWTEAFLWIEQFTEGDRYARIKLDDTPWNARKILRKSAKHLLWLLFALYTGLSFVAYFVPARELFPAAFRLELTGWPLFWGLFYGVATWGNAGFLREQVCKYMCPYARFQSAMFDRDTLTISYDEPRGEPRKGLARKLGKPAADCIDCSLCVQVCPTGIDIRDGLQYECIACAACVDVCNEVMDSVGKPRGLIRYTTARQEAGGAFRLLRPRAVGYGLIWGALCAGFVVTVLLRTPLEFDVIRDRHSLFRRMPDGGIENVYVVKVVNKDSVAHEFELEVELPDGTELEAEPDEFELGAGESRSVTVSVRSETIPASAVTAVEFTLEAEDQHGLSSRRKATFLAGGSP